MKPNRRTVLGQAILLPFALSGKASAATPQPLFDGVNSAVDMDFGARVNLFVAECGAGRNSCFAPDGACATFAEGLSAQSGLAIASDQSAPLTATWGDRAVFRIPLPS